MNDQCALCNREERLRESHIIPSFVSKWLKKSSVTGHFRSGEAINKRAQDGVKIYLLCNDCEQLFGGWEDIFAKEVFLPLHENRSIKQYGPWLLKFSTSVSWRLLLLFRNQLRLNHFPSDLLHSVDKTLQIWKKFLLNQRPHPDSCEQHILPFSGLISAHNDPEMPSNFNRYVSRSIDIDAACSKTEAFVYAKMCRILLIGFIKMNHRERWRDTKVHVNHGILEKKHYKVPATIRNFMYYKARRQQEVLKKISGRQWKQIGKDYEKHSDKFQDSEMFKAITQDFILFGSTAFDD